MKTFPTYDSNVPKKYYASFGEKEWTRLSRDCPGELLYHVHMDVLHCYVNQEASVLELGAGAGIFSKELVTLAKKLVVSDISEEQLAINKLKMTELGLADRIENFLILDITNLETVSSNQYDVVICVGGALNYTFDKEQALDQVKADEELWDLLLSKEKEFSKDPAYLNCGANLIYIVKKL